MANSGPVEFLKRLPNERGIDDSWVGPSLLLDSTLHRNIKLCGILKVEFG